MKINKTQKNKESIKDAAERLAEILIFQIEFEKNKESKIKNNKTEIIIETKI